MFFRLLTVWLCLFAALLSLYVTFISFHLIHLSASKACNCYNIHQDWLTKYLTLCYWPFRGISLTLLLRMFDASVSNCETLCGWCSFLKSGVAKHLSSILARFFVHYWKLSIFVGLASELSNFGHGSPVSVAFDCLIHVMVSIRIISSALGLRAG